MTPTLEREDLGTLQELVREAEKKGWPHEKALSFETLIGHLVSAAERAREQSESKPIEIRLKTYEPSAAPVDDADDIDGMLEELVKAMEALGIPTKVERTGFFTPQGAAEMLGVSKQTVLNWIKNGKISAERTVGGHFRIAVEDFARFDEEREAFRSYRPKIPELAEMSEEELAQRVLSRRRRRKSRWSEPS
jgi:excisionase family DNA binding protein